jgi:hypothetical protein
MPIVQRRPSTVEHRSSTCIDVTIVYCESHYAPKHPFRIADLPTLCVGQSKIQHGHVPVTMKPVSSRYHAGAIENCGGTAKTPHRRKHTGKVV